MSWTAERIEILKKRWAEGASAGDIAYELGDVSRNGVIGKVSRLGLERHPAGPAVAKKPKPPSAPKPQGILQAIKMRAAARMVGEVPYADPRPLRKEAFTFTGGVSLFDHKIGQCRWPNDGSVWDGSFRFCGAQASQRPWGSKGTACCPYCDRHAEIACPAARKAA